MLLLRCAIHDLYGECYLNPLTLDELLLVEDEMKGFKIPTTKEIEAWKKSRAKRKKVGDTFAIESSTTGDVTASGSSKSSPKTMPSQNRARVEEEDCILLWIPHSASSYSNGSFLEGLDPFSCFRRISIV